MDEYRFKKGIEEIKNTRLSDVDKKRVLESVFNTPIISPYAPKLKSFGVYFHPNWATYVFAILFLFVLVGGLLAYNAEKSLPGDNLYFLKVGVTEKARDLVNVSPEKKAEWESVKTVRRLDEALNLAAEGKLSEKNRIDLEARFNKHADAFDSSVTALASSTKKTKKSELIEVEFEADVAAKTKVIDNLEQKLKEENKKEKEKSETKEEREQIKKRDQKNDEEIELNKFKKAVSKKLEKIEDRKEARKSSDKRDENKDED